MKLYADGYTIEGNPSPFGGGYTVVDQHGAVLLTREERMRGYTNNEGELKACLEALKMAEHGDVIVVDSANTMNWIRKPFSKKRTDLMPLARECAKIMADKQVCVCWEPRETNLAGHYNEGLGLETKFSDRVPRKPKHVAREELWAKDTFATEEEYRKSLPVAVKKPKKKKAFANKWQRSIFRGDRLARGGTY